MRACAVGSVRVMGVAGCGSYDEAPAVVESAVTRPESSESPESEEAVETPDDAAGVATVPGYGPGEFPAIPMITLPDLGLLDTSLAAFTIKVDDSLGNIPGVRVVPASCDDAKVSTHGGGTMTLYGDGSGTAMGPDGLMVNEGDGSGAYSLNGVNVIVGGDGSGVYQDGSTSIVSTGDGSGTYDDGTTQITVETDGSGTYSRGDTRITLDGRGGGTAQIGDVQITNEGDGSGTYQDGSVQIINNGDGTALVGGATVNVEPLGPAPSLGKFPTMGTIKPAKSCGSRIIIDAAVLFDFGEADVRPEAGETLASVAESLAEVKVSKVAVQVHTDSIGTDDFNLDLSDRRAAAVGAALKAAGVTAAITEEGYGEKFPVAPNELKGKDNPPGRQLNRRVELLIPTS
jgi:OOP family OmpA-OmpF porin